MKRSDRTWLTFGDLRVGDRFRFNYNGGFGGVRLSSVVMVKISPRKYRSEDTGSEWQTRVATAVHIEGSTGSL